MPQDQPAGAPMVLCLAASVSAARGGLDAEICRRLKGSLYPQKATHPAIYAQRHVRSAARIAPDNIRLRQVTESVGTRFTARAIPPRDRNAYPAARSLAKH